MPSPKIVKDPYAVSAWGEEPFQDVVCPSGQVCLVKKLGMEDLISLGLTNDADFLSGIAGQKVSNARDSGHATKKPTKAQLADSENNVKDMLKKDPKSFKKFSELVNKIIVAAVQKPQLHLPPMKTVEGEEVSDIEARAKGRIYADSIDFNDKMEIFNFTMSGTVDMTPFRGEPTDAVGDLEHGEVVQLPSE